MRQPGPAGVAKVAVGVLAIAAILFIFRSPHQEDGGAIRPVGQRLPMPDFTMPDLEGGKWHLSEHKGRVVLVNFWATWCPPCLEELPGLMRLAKSRGELDIAGIAMDHGEQTIRQFVKAARMNYPVLLPPASSPLTETIEGLPTTFLVDKQGKVARHYVGAFSERTMRADIDRVLAEL
jgi:cytochrome c biogenesis protein CcmG, thiol:disulfide interchange protein DsbE